MAEPSETIGDLPVVDYAAYGGVIPGTAKIEVEIGTGPGSSFHGSANKLPISEAVAAALEGKQDVGTGGGGLQWSVATTNTTLAADAPIIAVNVTDHTLPSPLEATKQYVVHAKVDGVRIVSNGNVITGVGAGNNLLLAAGETAHLVASSTNTLEVV